MNFRIKIVLWLSLVIFLALVGVRLATLEVVKTMLLDDLDSSLHAELIWARDILVSYKARGISDDEIRREIQERSSLNPRKVFATIRHAGGSVYFNTHNLEGQPLPGVDSLSEPVTVSGVRSQQIRLIGMHDGNYSFTVAYSLVDVDAAIDKILVSAAVVVPVTLLLGIAGGLVVVGRFLKPVKEVNQFLAAAATHSLSHDLPHLDVTKKDEIGELSRRVTEAVGKMRTSMRWILSYSSLVPHQLRTPVAVMRSQLESVMEQDVPRSRLQQTMISTYDEILKLNNIIDDLLNLGKLQAGTMRLEKRRIAIAGFLADFGEEACALVRWKGIQFVLHEGPDIELMADEQWLRQVLFNLLDNAIRHTPDVGQISVACAVRGDSLELRFSDTGEGIQAEEMPLLFEPFFQGKYRDNKSYGSGLGLVLVKLIVSAHGGTIAVESSPGEGATFVIGLPLMQEVSSEPSLEAP
jgi:signal transduction histidine kinase